MLKCRHAFTLVLSAACLIAASPSLTAQATPPPPPTRVENATTVLHGVTVSDPYQWLEDKNSLATRSWIAAQQQYTAALLTSRAGMTALRRQTRALADLAEPHRVIERRGEYFIEEKAAGEQIASIYVRKGAGGKDRLLIDPAGLSAHHSATVELLNVSADARLVAYGVRRGGRDQLSIRFRDVATDRDLADTLPEARYLYWSLPISPDGSKVFYVRFDDDGPHIFSHRFGRPLTDDALLFGTDLGPQKLLAASLSPDGNYLLVTVLHGASGATDLLVKDLRTAEPLSTAVAGINATFNGLIAGHTLYVQTNWHAGRGQVFAVDVDHPAQSNWKLLIPEMPDAVIQSIALTSNRLIVNTIHDAHSELHTYTLTGKQDSTIPLPGVGSVATLDPDPLTPELCFPYSSFNTPSGFYSWTPGATVPISVPQVPAALRDVVVDQVWYPSTAGARVPMFLAHRRGVRPDGQLPVLLYGYGGFSWAQLPTFTPEEAVWLERGGVYAIANIRGGNEFGESWHRAGELDQKQNSFDDFANAARWLIANHYTQPDRLAIQGLSNGGLLVTASLTQHPELFGAVIGRYPLIDMVRYERFTIARWWVSEYGSVSDAAEFKTLYAYSPYQHVVRGTKYPAVLFISGDGDTRVDPSHARKMTAMLQNATASGKPVLLLYNSHSGHSGTLAADAEVEQTANEIEFLDLQLNLPEASE